jgi:hypothetical protein
MGFNGFETPCVTAHYSLGYWVVPATNGHVVGYIASPRLHFISAWLVGWMGEPRGLHPGCEKYHYKAKMDPFFFVHSFSYHDICHPVHKFNCGIPCVCTGGFHHQEYSTLASLCWSTEQTLDSSSSSVDRGDHYGLSHVLLVVMDWWCIVVRVDYCLAPLIM